MARRWKLRLAAIIVGFLPLLLVELSLRTFDFPNSDSTSDPFLDFTNIRPLFVESSPGKLSIPPERLRLFAKAEFERNKPEATKRIFALGGSTTQGEPYGPPTAFPEWLKLNLELADSIHQFEVINGGGLSYASYRVLPILCEVLDYDPDLIVVYTGQNEFLEARELADWRSIPTPIASFASEAVRLRTVSWCRSFFSKPIDAPKTSTRLQSEVDALLDYQGGLAKYNRADLDHAAVTASFHWNIERMVEACRERKVPLVFVVPTVNIKDCPPFKFEVDPKLSEADRKQIEAQWLTITNSPLSSRSSGRLADSVSDGRATSPLELAHEMLKLDPQHAGVHYFLGQYYFSIRDWELAEKHLCAAKEFDVCPLRATLAIQQTVREVARKHSVPFVDADDLFRSLSPHQIVGREWLIDHVHPTIEGHQRLGEALCRLLIDEAWLDSSRPISDEAKITSYRNHLGSLGEDYFHRGKQRLEGLMLWTQGRAKKIPGP